MTRLGLLVPILLLVACSPEVIHCDVCGGSRVTVVVADPARSFRLEVCVEQLDCDVHQISRDELEPVRGDRARVHLGLEQRSGLGGRTVTVTYTGPGGERVDSAEIDSLTSGSGDCRCYTAWATLRL